MGMPPQRSNELDRAISTLRGAIPDVETEVVAAILTVIQEIEEMEDRIEMYWESAMGEDI